MIASESRQASWRRVVAALVGLAVVLWGNYYLRHTLEEAPRRLYSFMEYYYAADIPAVFAKQWWEFLLPMKEFTGAWTTTTMILTYLLERRLTPGGVWLLYNAVSILVAFATSWIIFRSAIFALTFAICVGFGTHFYHAYAVSGGIASYVMLIYNVLLMFTIVQVVKGAAPKSAWWAALGASLALNVLGYEGWLDVLVIVWVAAPLAYVTLRRMQAQQAAKRLVAVALVLTLTGVAYVLVKVNMGFGQRDGSESDVVFNYDAPGPIVDDIGGNLFTHTYLAVSNFLPPALVGPSTFYRQGAGYLVSGQHGYHSDYSYLVVLNQVFQWRFHAGAVFVIVLGGAVVTWRRAWTAPSVEAIAVGVFLLMILFAGATHTAIKFRPMKSMPVMTYHVTVGVIGMSLLIAWGLATLWRRAEGRALLAATVIATVWLAIVYGALARPAYLAHMAAQSGLGEYLYPDPMRALYDRLGWEYEVPQGLPAYRLMPYNPDEGLAAVRAALPNLPDALPPVGEWLPGDPSWVTPTDGGGVEVHGDDTQFGYQIISPAFAVRPGTRYLLRIRYQEREGRVCAGVLSGNQQQWLVPPDGKTAEYAFDSGAFSDIRVVVANCYAYDRGNPRSRFTLSGGSFAALATPGATQ